MATVRMRKGDKFADIFDSPDTIRQARLEGWSLVEGRQTDGKQKQPDAAETAAGDDGKQKPAVKRQ